MTSELNFEQPTHEGKGTPNNYFSAAEWVTVSLEAQFFSCPRTLLLVYSTRRLVRSTLRNRFCRHSSYQMDKPTTGLCQGRR